MRICELIDRQLHEGMTFTAGVIKTQIGPDGQPHRVVSVSDLSVEKDEPCAWCGGTGQETFYQDDEKQEYTCRNCGGKGTTREWSSRGPELSVSNTNGYLIQELLGVAEPDYAGSIPAEKLPEVQRKLIRLKNQSQGQFTRPATVDRGSMGVTGQDQNVTHIGRQGPVVYNMGVTDQQLERYIDRLLELVHFAMVQGREMGKPVIITWG